MANSHAGMAPSSSIALWARAMRAPFFTASATPVFIGTAAAWALTGKFDLVLFLLATFGSMLAHAGANLSNDFFDTETGDDRVNRFRTPFNGGTGVIVEGSLTGKQVFGAALGCFGLGALIGLYLAWRSGPAAIVLMVLGFLCGFFYTAGPIRAAYRGFGEIVLGFAFGPLIGLGAYFVQTQLLDPVGFVVSVPIGLLVTAILYINQFPDFEADSAVNKRNLVVRLGTRRAVVGYYAMIALTYLWILLMPLWPGLPMTVWLGLLTLPMAVRASAILGANHDKPPALVPAQAMTIGAHLLTGLLMTAGLLVNRGVIR